MRRIVLAATSVAALACLSGCNSRGEAAQAAPVAPPTVTGAPTPTDPYAWVDVPYKDYLDAADQIGLRPDVLVPEAGFSSSLNTLCHTSPADLATLRKTQLANRDGTDTYTTAKYLGDEVGLRLGLACPQRMADWAATDDEGDGSVNPSPGPTDDVSEVSGAELARAEAEEHRRAGSGAGGDSSPSPTASSADHTSTTGAGASTGSGAASR